MKVLFSILALGSMLLAAAIAKPVAVTTTATTTAPVARPDITTTTNRRAITERWPPYAADLPKSNCCQIKTTKVSWIVDWSTSQPTQTTRPTFHDGLCPWITGYEPLEEFPHGPGEAKEPHYRIAGGIATSTSKVSSQ